jgi:hypothetical protein
MLDHPFEIPITSQSTGPHEYRMMHIAPLSRPFEKLSYRFADIVDRHAIHSILGAKSG